MPLTFVTCDESKTGSGMVPNEPHHVAVIVSLTADGGINVGVSGEMVSHYGQARCDQLQDHLAEAFAMWTEPRQ